jgi:hypothetical protein
MLPKSITDAARAYRYATEGVVSLKGDEIVPQEALSGWDIALKAAGFAPDKIARQYAANNGAKEYEGRILRRRTMALSAWGMAVIAGDHDGVAAARDEIRAYNAAVPEAPITGETMRRSLRQRQRMRGVADRGIILSKRLRGVRDETEVPE